MKLRRSSVLSAALLLMASLSAVADGDAALGRKKAETCMGCHAVPGYFNVYPSYHVPKLGGQSGKYIESALKQYRDGGRQHGTMHANASGLSEQDMADIGAYIESYRK
jgi:cytochrome c553